MANDVPLHLHRADERRTAELLRDGTVLAAVTTQAEAVPGCVVGRLGAMRYRPMAAPRFARAQGLLGRGRSGALRTAPVLAFDADDRLQADYLAAHAPGAAPPEHRVPATAEFGRAIELGLGWGMLPDLQSAEAEAAGRLVCFDEDGAVAVPLAWQQWRLRSEALDALAEAVAGAARAALA